METVQNLQTMLDRQTRRVAQLENELKQVQYSRISLEEDFFHVIEQLRAVQA